MAFVFSVEEGLGQNIGFATFSGLPSDGDTITINDGSLITTFEFDNNATVASGNVSVTIGTDASDSADIFTIAVNKERTDNSLAVFAVATGGSVQINNQNIVGGLLSIGTLTNVAVTSFQKPASYVALADAQTMIESNIHATGWAALGSSDQEKLLAFATDFIDIHTRFKGYKTVSLSLRSWPRTGVVNDEYVAIGANEIPYQLQYATAMMANYLVSDDRTTERPQDGLESIKADVVELVFREGYKLPTVPSEMHQLLEGLGVISAGGRGTAKVLRT